MFKVNFTSTSNGWNESVYYMVHFKASMTHQCSLHLQWQSHKIVIPPSLNHHPTLTNCVDTCGQSGSSTLQGVTDDPRSSCRSLCFFWWYVAPWINLLMLWCCLDSCVLTDHRDSVLFQTGASINDSCLCGTWLSAWQMRQYNKYWEGWWTDWPAVCNIDFWDKTHNRTAKTYCPAGVVVSNYNKWWLFVLKKPLMYDHACEYLDGRGVFICSLYDRLYQTHREAMKHIEVPTCSGLVNGWAIPASHTADRTYG